MQMTRHNHYIIKCECGAVILQCLCLVLIKRVKYETCIVCKQKQLWEKGKYADSKM